MKKQENMKKKIGHFSKEIEITKRTKWELKVEKYNI